MTAIVVIAFEMPRYIFATFAMGVIKVLKTAQPPSPLLRVSAIVPTSKGGLTICGTVKSLLSQNPPLHEIIIVDDGSPDQCSVLLQEFSKTRPALKIIHHKQRAGKSAAINHGAYFATGELLLIIDDDTELAPTGALKLAMAFSDDRVAAASGNLMVKNCKENPLTALQTLEYLLAMPIGRGFLNYLNAMSCCSGAFSMFRTDRFKDIGGMNVGPGEDLEITLRLRQAGYRTKFVDSALGLTEVPTSVRALFRQRLRWDGDAFAIRVLMYREMSFLKKNESLGNSLQRFDYIFFDLLPTILFPFYLTWLWLQFGSSTLDILIALYSILFWLYLLNVVLAITITNKSLTWLDIAVLPIMPLYQGIAMRLVRFIAISDEILLARSHQDPLVPSNVRQSLYGDRHRD